MSKLIAIGVVVAISAMLLFLMTASGTGGYPVTLYKSPLCGCCGEYVKYLQRNGFEVNVVSTVDMDNIKTDNGIPYDMQSCHTMTVDGYYIEGHVPVEAVNIMLAEKPDVDGIALPGMPAGSPGMSGIKRGEFVVYSIVDGEETPYKVI